MNIVEIMPLGYECVSFGYMPCSDITGSLGRLSPSFLRNHHNAFWTGCTSLQSHQKWRSVPLALHPFQHRLTSMFFNLSILTGVRWYFRVVLICISLMAEDVEQFFKGLSAIVLLRISFLALDPIF